jgi:hypothetical protein
MERAKWVAVVLALAALVATPFMAQAADESPKTMKGKMEMPAAEGKALWDYLKSINYEKKFALWPGKKKFYKGTEPHGMLLTTYVNKPALGAIKGKKATLPVGSIVVKENYMPDKKLGAYTVMYKVAGYNPEAGDWFWAKYQPDGKIEMEGKADMCIGCHAQAKGNDYLMTLPKK